MTRNKNPIIFFSVPDPEKVSGGPRTRITQVEKALINQYGAFSIVGDKEKKLRNVLRAPASKVLYIESSSNRLKLVDVFLIIILVFKCRETVVFIRDVYTEFFPENYRTASRKLTYFANKLSNLFFSLIAKKMAFPTKQMGRYFYKKNPLFFKRQVIALPPGTFMPRIDNKNEVLRNEKTEKRSFLYLGATTYEHAGFDDFLQIAADDCNQDHHYYIMTNDALINVENTHNITCIQGLSHQEVIQKIIDIKITFAIHTRPRNEYDDITIPIKFMDFISVLTPVITAAHLPVVDLLGKDYPYFVPDFQYTSIKTILEDCNTEQYNSTIKWLKEIREELLYSNTFKACLDI